MEHTDFLLAGASVTGRDHRNVNLQRNSQDGFYIARDAGCTVAVVTDGCGSSLHSEVGAQLGARLVSHAVLREAALAGCSLIDWQRVLSDTLSALDVLATQMGSNFRRTVIDYFLFTVVGVVLTNEEAIFFALGDGVVIVNGEVTTLGPFPGNEPPYAGYGLLRREVPALQVVTTAKLSQLEHFLIGCDGVFDLIAARDKNLPGLNEPVGDISQFWHARYFDAQKPDLLGRRLRTISRDWPKRDPDPGLLPDDTTLVVGRAAPL